MLSQTTEYALRAMTCLAIGQGERVSSATLADMTQAPPDYLAKVLQLLTRAGLVAGRRGVGGGYRLAKPADQIRLLDVVRATTELDRITTCPLGLPNHGKNLCPLHKKMDEAAKAVIEIMDDITLHDLLNQPGENKPLCNADTTARLSVSVER